MRVRSSVVSMSPSRLQDGRQASPQAAPTVTHVYRESLDYPWCHCSYEYLRERESHKGIKRWLINHLVEEVSKSQSSIIACCTLGTRMRHAPSCRTSHAWNLQLVFDAATSGTLITCACTSCIDFCILVSSTNTLVYCLQIMFAWSGTCTPEAGLLMPNVVT